MSRSPAIIPIDIGDLNFITGISLLESWKKYVRRNVVTTNFSPGDVASCFVPRKNSCIGGIICQIGLDAREIIEMLIQGDLSMYKLNNLNDQLYKAEKLLSEQLDVDFSFNPLVIDVR